MERPILLVEDNEDDVFLMKMAAKQAGLARALDVAEDGEVAMAYLTRSASANGGASLPSLILLDLKMPRVPGLEFLQWLGHQSPLQNIPVVILTSSSADSDIQSAYDLGAKSYFTKPADSASLVQLVKLLNEYWLKQCLLPPARRAARD